MYEIKNTCGELFFQKSDINIPNDGFILSSLLFLNLANVATKSLKNCLVLSYSIEGNIPSSANIFVCSLYVMLFTMLLSFLNKKPLIEFSVAIIKYLIFISSH